MRNRIRTLTLLCIAFLLFRPIHAKWTLSHDLVRCNDTRAVFWFKAENGTNFVHFIFAADKHVRPPAIIALHSRYAESKISVNCTALNSNDTFRGSVTANAITASYGIVVYEFCEYVDEEDDASIKPDSHCIHHYGSNIEWSVDSVVSDSPSKVTAIFRGTHSNDSHDVFMDNGAFVLKFSIFDADTEPMDEFYYKVTGGLGVALTLTIDRLKVVESRSRVVPIVLVFSNQSLEDDDDFKEVAAYPDGISQGPVGKLKSSYLLLDRRVKHSPSPSSDSPPGYTQFPPVSWANFDHRDQKSMRFASLGQRVVYEHKGRAHKITFSLVYAYYKDRFNQPHQGSHEGYVGLRAQFINLGSPGDGYYRASNYSSWTMVLSFGYPTLEAEAYPGTRTALLTIGILSTLGAVGTAGYWYHKRRRQSQIYRFESLSHSVPSTPPESGPSDTMDSLEPFQRRKLRFPFGLGRRSTPDGTSSREPLLLFPQDGPPDYHSVVSASS